MRFRPSFAGVRCPGILTFTRPAQIAHFSTSSWSISRPLPISQATTKVLSLTGKNDVAMAAAERFRLRQAITAFRNEGTAHLLVTVPAGSAVTVIRLPQSGVGLADVRWNGRVVQVFLRDLQESCEFVNETETSEG